MARNERGGRKWSDLSPDYRRRLQRTGITREAWLRGADLRGARSHAPAPPPDAAPPAVTRRVIAGEGTRNDLSALNAWARTHADQFPFGMSADTAAALSQIRTPLDQWDRVEFTPRPDGQPWTMTVYPKGGGYPETVDIPGGGAADTSGASEVLDMLSEEDIDFDVEGS